ncbi:MAG: FMN-binding protein, partial [Clostridiales bacterium]|nr:FMN-binding protein [Clostridiales bacterium]
DGGVLSGEGVSVRTETVDGLTVCSRVAFPLKGLSATYATSTYLYVPAMKNLNGEISGIVFDNGKFSVDSFVKLYWDTLQPAAGESGEPEEPGEPLPGEGEPGGAQFPHGAGAKNYRDGVYEGKGDGYHSGVTTLSVSIENNEIGAIEVISHGDSPDYFAACVPGLLDAIIGARSASVDAISGATFSSEGIKAAVADALKKAGRDMPDDGVYESVPVAGWHQINDTPSMMSGMVAPDAAWEVSNGEIYATVRFVSVTIFGGLYKGSDLAEIMTMGSDGEYRDAEVLFVNDEGGTQTVRFHVPDARTPVMTSLYVPAMGATQVIRLFFDVSGILPEQEAEASGMSMDWFRAFGSSGSDSIFDVKATSDGGFVTAGGIAARNGDGEDLAEGDQPGPLLVKYDADGAVEWKRAPTGPQAYYYWQTDELAGGGYAAAGFSQIDRFGADGASVWGRTFDATFYGVSATRDGGFVAYGCVRGDSAEFSGHQGGDDCLIAKFGPGSALEWARVFGGSLNENIRSVAETSDGKFVAVGASRSADGDLAGTRDAGGTTAATNAMIALLSGAGELEWVNTLVGTGVDEFRGVIEAKGGFIAAGTAQSANYDYEGLKTGGRDILVASFSGNGELTAASCYGSSGHDYGYGIVGTLDGGYAVAGSAGAFNGLFEDFAVGTGRMVLLKFSAGGALEYMLNSGGTNGNDAWYGVCEIAPGRFVAAGATGSNDGDVAGLFHGVFDGALAQFTIDGYTPLEPGEPSDPADPGEPTDPGEDGLYYDGTYEGIGAGHGGFDIVTRVTIKDDIIQSIRVISHEGQLEHLWAQVDPEYIDRIIAAQSTEVDTISHATNSCVGVRDAVNKALLKANALPLIEPGAYSGVSAEMWRADADGRSMMAPMLHEEASLEVLDDGRVYATIKFVPANIGGIDITGDAVKRVTSKILDTEYSELATQIPLEGAENATAFRVRVYNVLEPTLMAVFHTGMNEAGGDSAVRLHLQLGHLLPDMDVPGESIDPPEGDFDSDGIPNLRDYYPRNAQKSYEQTAQTVRAFLRSPARTLTVAAVSQADLDGMKWNTNISLQTPELTVIAPIVYVDAVLAPSPGAKLAFSRTAPKSAEAMESLAVAEGG